MDRIIEPGETIHLDDIPKDQRSGKHNRWEAHYEREWSDCDKNGMLEAVETDTRKNGGRVQCASENCQEYYDHLKRKQNDKDKRPDTPPLEFVADMYGYEKPFCFICLRQKEALSNDDQNWLEVNHRVGLNDSRDAEVCGEYGKHEKANYRILCHTCHHLIKRAINNFVRADLDK